MYLSGHKQSEFGFHPGFDGGRMCRKSALYGSNPDALDQNCTDDVGTEIISVALPFCQ